MKFVFVCTGNSCRSVMAEYLLNKMAADRGLANWEARSAGIAAERYFPVPQGVRNALAERGITRIDHTPQLAGRELLGWADVILPMAKIHLEALLDQYPEFTDKTSLFMKYAEQNTDTADVADPIGKPDKVYQRCRNILEKGLAAILERHAAKNN